MSLPTGKRLEVSQGRITRAEIVQRQFDAHAVQGRQGAEIDLGVVHHGPPGEFEFEKAGVEAGKGQGAGHHIDEGASGGTAPARRSRPRSTVAGFRRLPGHGLLADFEQHPVANAVDEAGILRDRDEAGREIMPIWGWRQRMRASTPTIRPLPRATRADSGG